MARRASEPPVLLVKWYDVTKWDIVQSAAQGSVALSGWASASTDWPLQRASPPQAG